MQHSKKSPLLTHWLDRLAKVEVATDLHRQVMINKFNDLFRQELSPSDAPALENLALNISSMARVLRKIERGRTLLQPKGHTEQISIILQ